MNVSFEAFSRILYYFRNLISIVFKYFFVHVCFIKTCLLHSKSTSFIRVLGIKIEAFNDNHRKMTGDILNFKLGIALISRIRLDNASVIEIDGMFFIFKFKKF